MAWLYVVEIGQSSFVICLLFSGTIIINLSILEFIRHGVGVIHRHLVPIYSNLVYLMGRLCIVFSLNTVNCYTTIINRIDII